MDTILQRPVAINTGLSAFAARTPTLPPATHTNSYALGTRQVVLVEPATPYEDEQLAWQQWAAQLVGQGLELQAIVVTHYHPDHVGGADALSRAVGVPLWTHADTAALLPDVVFERLLEEGEVIELDGPTPQRWQCLVTPGHAPGHLCLHEASLGVTVVGDMVASEGTILINPEDGHLATYMKQLRRLEALGSSVALPAHGDPIDDPAGCYQHYLTHRQAREDKVRAALTNSPQDLDALLPKVYGDVSPKLWPFAALSLRAHLIKLVEEERATALSADTTPMWTG